MLLDISIEEAQAKLPEIIDKLGPGEEVVITKDDQPVAKLRSIAEGKPQPRFGSCKGMLTIVAEDEEHLEDFKDICHEGFARHACLSVVRPWQPSTEEQCQELKTRAMRSWSVRPAIGEIAIKISLNKYRLSQPYEEFIQKDIRGNGFIILPIEPKHTAALTSLPFHHRDPFDRLIIAQAMVEQIPVISSDSAFAAYPVIRIW